ncbi:MAG: lysozyme [Alphaproteobacteria bacterium]|nr:lysozyme [Alphaproteobacteria bacterium]
MKISNNGINMLKRLEGCVKQGDKHVIYDDKTGKPVNPNKPLPPGATIGYGHLITRGEDFATGITETAATDLLCADIAVAERAVGNNITTPLTQNQYDALVSLAYNIGARNFANSTVVKYINNPNFRGSVYPTLESAWKAWNKSGGKEMPGLTNRRNQEFALFNS